MTRMALRLNWSVRAIVGSAALMCAAVGTAAASDMTPLPNAAPGTVIFSGSDYKQDANFSYIGVVHALNRNLASDGFLFRVFGGFGNYEYDTTGVPGGNVDTDLTMVDVGLGYHMFSGGLVWSAYVSASYEDHDSSPADPGNPVQGDEWGAKFTGEVETAGNSPFYFGVLGSYSTAFDGYWARGRLGLNVGRDIVIGPELVGLGNEGFDQVRYGAFISGLPTLFSLVFGGDSKMTISGGWADTREGGTGQGGDDSAYGAISSSFAF